jgi:hypothetical protein
VVMVRVSGLIVEADRDPYLSTGILLILTLAKAFSYRDQFNRTCVTAYF